MNANQEGCCCCRCCCCRDPQAAAVALARWLIGVLLLVSGLGKFSDLNGFVDFLLDTFRETWLPAWLLRPYGYALPFMEVTLGGLLILGLFRTPVLFAAGLLMLSLTFGQMLLKEFDVVHNNAVYVVITAAVLFLGKRDRWVLFPRPRKEQELAANPPVE